MVGEADGHTWVIPDGRRFMTKQFGPIDHTQCKYCERDFITVVSTSTRLAVFVSILSFWILSPAVTEHWLSRCPGTRSVQDDEDRLQRVEQVTLWA